MESLQKHNSGHLDIDYIDYVIITNSPGELSAWVKPVGKLLKEKRPNSRVIILLVPCFYSTGREREIAQKFSFADTVLGPKDFIKMAFGLKAGNFKPAKKGVVISLGGDPWHAALISKKFKYPAVIYTMKQFETASHFKHTFVIHELLKHHILRRNNLVDSRVEVVGDLMQDSVQPEMTPQETRKKWNLQTGSQLITLFPGSRLPHVEESLPVFLKVCEQIRESNPKSRFIVCLSPFVKLEDVKKFIKKRKHYLIEGTWGELKDNCITTEKGVKVDIAQQYRYDLISISDLVITIPGTNTAEIASLGKPMIVAFTWKAKIPSGGLGFFVNAIPLTGILKKAVMSYTYRNVKFKGLPNALAGKEITPEVVVDESAEQITSVAKTLLSDEKLRSDISVELLKIMGGGGAALKIADKIIQIGDE